MLALGIVLLGILLWKMDPKDVLDHLVLLGWWWLPLVALEGIGECLHTMAWRRCLVGTPGGLSWVRVGMVRQAGMAFNYLTPTAHMGGELVKAMLLGGLGDGVGAATSVIVGKLALAAAQLVFVSCGSFVALWSVSLPKGFMVAWVLSTFVFLVGIASFFWLQRRGRLGALVRFLRGKGLGGRGLSAVANWLGKVDGELEAFHRERPGDFVKAMLWHVAGFSLGILQVWLFLGWMGHSMPLRDGAAIWFLGAWFDLVGFVVPAGVGVQEGARALIFDLMGLKGASGLALGLVLRGTKGFWALVGLGCYVALLRNWRFGKGEG